MQLVPTNEFLAWAGHHGIGRSPQYPQSDSLWFSGEGATWYRYRPSTPTGHSAADLDAAVTVAGAGGPIWCFPPNHDGTWVGATADLLPWEPPVLAAMRAGGIRPGYIGAIGLRKDEIGLAAHLLAAALDGNAQWPFAIIPEHARCLLLADEDGNFVGAFPDAGALAGFTHALAAAGWKEPTEPDSRVSLTDPWLES